MTQETRERVNTLTALMADEAERLGAECNDTEGIVRGIVQRQGLSFNAWFCVCCELADREAKREGYKDKVDRAFRLAQGKTEGVTSCRP